MKRKILYITGTRADYGLMRNLLFCINEDPELDLELAVTGMHLMEEFGMTLNEIEGDGFVTHMFPVVFKEDNPESMLEFLASLIQLLNEKMGKIQPDLILLLGDRIEMLAGAIVGTYLQIPTAHLHGGEITSTVDEYARHAITKLANIHFPATEKSKERIIRMGEDPSYIWMVGAPGLDSVLNQDLLTAKEISHKYHLDLSKPILLVLQHPVTLEYMESASQMRETMEALVEMGHQTIVIYPNADAGGRRMIEVIREYAIYPFIQAYPNLPNLDYLSLMKVATVMLGNSSSGLIEAPSFGLPVVNIGSRQEGRERGFNVLNVGYDREEIIKTVKRAINDDDFRRVVKKSRNPYGNGRTSQKVVEILKKVNLDRELLQKKINI